MEKPVEGKVTMMKALLMATAFLESAFGLALLAMPALFVSYLLGAELDSSAVVLVARVAGAALVSLGLACWLGSRDAESRAAAGVVVGMVFYNLAAVALFVSARTCSGLTGIGLLPASAVHAAMAVWCLAGLRKRAVRR